MATLHKHLIDSIIIALLALLVVAQSVVLADTAPNWGFIPIGAGGGGGGAPLGANYLVYPSLHPDLTAERLFVVSSPLGITDGGANGNATLSLSTVPLTLGGSGQTTAQASMNAFADGAAGTGAAAAAAGDILVRGATNWLRLPQSGVNDQTLVIDTSLAHKVKWAAPPSGAPTSAEYIVGSLNGTLSNEQVLTGGDGIDATIGGGTATIDVDSTVIRTTGAQSLASKTLTNPIVDNTITFERGTNDPTFTLAATSGARAYTIDDAGADASVIMSKGAQSLDGVKTFVLAPKLTTNTITTSTGNTITFINSTDTVVNLASAQTLSNKTVATPIITGGFVLASGGAGNYIFTGDSVSSDRTITIKDPNGDADIRFFSGTLNAGGALWTDGNVIRSSAAGTSGKPLLSQGSGAPVYQTLGADGGGTGIASYTAGDLIRATGTSTLAALAKGTANQVLGMNSGATDQEYKTIVAGTNISVVHGANSITINNTGSGTGTVTSVGLSVTSFPLTASGTPVTTSGTLNLTPSCAKGDIIAGTGTNTMAMLNVGSNYKALCASSGASSGLAYKEAHLFGGAGKNNAPPTSGTITGELWVDGNWTTTGTITCERCRIHVTGDASIQHTINCSTELAGGVGIAATSQAEPGHGLGGGMTQAAGAAGGGGGGNGGIGGKGSQTTSPRTSAGGCAYFLENYLGGSSGAAGVSDGTGAGGNGGAAGAGFYLEVGGNLTINGVVNADGGNATNGASNDGGGGGGSGGTIDVRVLGNITVSTAKTWEADGGTGGNGGTGGAGGGGGGGNINVQCNGTLTETGTLTLQANGGTKGTGANSSDASDGSAGVTNKEGSAKVSFRSAN